MANIKCIWWLRKRNDITYNSVNQYLKYRGFKYIIQNQPFNVGFKDEVIEILAVKEEIKTVTEIIPILAGIFDLTFDNTFN